MKGQLIAILLMAASPVLAQAPAVPAATTTPKYSVQTTTMGEMVANPQTKALLEKYFPEVINHPQFNEGLGLTLPDIVQYLPDVVTPPKMAAMDVELKALQ
jgi:para-nitrobenzyl esterase